MSGLTLKLKTMVPTFPITPEIKLYNALITQSDTNAPTVIILKNTLGTITWTRSAAGLYVGTKIGAFKEPNKIFTIISNNFSTQAGMALYRNDDDSVGINTGLFGLGVWPDQDGMLFNTYISIGIYQ